MLPVRGRANQVSYDDGPGHAAFAQAGAAGAASRANAEATLAALQFCAGHGIGAFPINSQILAVKTHPEAGYAMDEQLGTANRKIHHRYFFMLIHKFQTPEALTERGDVIVPTDEVHHSKRASATKIEQLHLLR